MSVTLDFWPSPMVKHNWPEDYEEQFWRECPRKVDKDRAMKTLRKIRDAGGVQFETILAGMQRYAAWLEEKGQWRPHPKHPNTWLNGANWKDELISGTPRVSFADIARGNFRGH